MNRIATCTDQLSIVLETDALLFANCDQAFFNSLLDVLTVALQPADRGRDAALDLVER